MTTETSTLTDLHDSLGASWTELAGRRAVAAYGSPERERQALVTACGVVDRSWGDRLELTGEDRLRFLNGRLTCDVQSLEPGSSVYGFFTSRQGKILADVTVLALDDRLWLELPPGRGEEIAEHLQKFIIADRVEVCPLSDRTEISLVGPAAAGVLAGMTPLPEGPGEHREAELAGIAGRLLHQPLWGLEAFTLWVSAESAAPAFAALLEHGRGEGAAPVGFTATEIVRVERGVPRFGADFGPDNFPQETGLDHAVSYTKGCYLGQEVVARIHYRGQVNRHFRGLAFEAAEPPAAGTPLFLEEREVGRVGTAVASPVLGAIGLAVIHRRAANPGATLELEGGGRAEVRELPLLIEAT